METKYPWRYCSLGGVTRVKLSTGEDIAHLGELDQKLWTVLSCPVDGLIFDRKTLEILDSDKDGRIRVGEVVAAAEWLTSVVKDKDLILNGSDSLPLDSINTENPTGERLARSARQILSNLGLDKNEISLADTSDSVKIFEKTTANGDGIICADAGQDPQVRQAIEAAVATVGSKTDRSGAQGVDAALVEQFYAELAAHKAWKAARTPEILPYGESTPAALAAVEAIASKVEDYFIRCRLIAFNGNCAAALDSSAATIEAFGSQDLNGKTAEIASCPLAHPRAELELPLDAVNPAWEAAIAAFRTEVFDKSFPQKNVLTEEQWKSIVASFGPYKNWLAAKAGSSVESLGDAKIDELLAADKKADILALIDADLAVAQEANSIDEVDKLMHLFRYFYEFLDNYVIFGAFYDKNRKSVFEAGKLYIDQRCLELCINVADMGKHADMASLSGMYIIYCNCVSKKTGKTATIAAVLTDGDVDNLRVGMNCVYYDRDGLDYDAVITKLVDNPVSVRQAFWAPYRKLARTISDRINKSAAEKDAKVTAALTDKANNFDVAKAKEEAAAAQAAPKQSFDIAKFAGIFAALGMAVGFIGSALAKLIHPWYTPFIVLVVLVVVISGPSMFIAWTKLRKRNLGPVLNANGWAINSRVLVNIVFGSTLTTLAKYPKLARTSDPYVKKKSPWPAVIFIFLLVLVAVGLVLYFTGNLGWLGITK